MTSLEYSYGPVVLVHISLMQLFIIDSLLIWMKIQEEVSINRNKKNE
ncbi:hypothetical protein LL3_01908 [Bacillus amyloliquefaciens LL3]|nr:hypothetical protein LL3_01908 [Bacillus amyloliquefaciens LL3]